MSKTIDVSRPKPGHLPKPEGFQDGWDLARDGDVGAAIRSKLVERREQLANELHYRLRSMVGEFDRACRELEEGKRGSVLRVTNWHHELPAQLEGLVQACQAIQDADYMIHHAANTRPETVARTLERAADVLDGLVEDMGLKGEHPLTGKLKAEAIGVREREDQRQEQEATAREDRAAEARAKRNKRPLGQYEKNHLVAAAATDAALARHYHGLHRKALDSLVERGYMTRGRSKAGESVYEITDAGRERAGTLNV